MSPEFRIISIGTLSAHPLWNEKADVRSGHATTTLISVGDTHILVDPSLPAPALLARLTERSRTKPHEITHVFLTSFQSERRRALSAFEHAIRLIHEPERDAARAQLQQSLEEHTGDRELSQFCERDIEALRQCQAAPDRLAPNVDLFPLPGVTAGTCGLLLSLPGTTALICGDAIPTLEHLMQGKVLPDCVDIARAQESFREAVEIADVLVLGRDNLVLNPLRRI